MSEHDEQAALIRWCGYNESQYADLDLIYATPNGGKRSKRTAARLKAEGVKAGIPDLQLPVARGEYIGLFIEMKYGKNKTTPDQKRIIARLREVGHRVEVCYGWEAARDVIIDYLGEV